MATEVIVAGAGLEGPRVVEDRGNCSVTISEARVVAQTNPNPSNWIKPGTDGQVAPGNNQQKKHHRRKPSKKKRKWKPYSKMSWEERKVLEEKEKSKAVRMREEMKEKGRPVAPYNTTQFLMDEHDPYDNSSFEPSGYNNNSNATGTEDGESYSEEGDQDEMNGSVISKDGDEVDESMGGYTDSPHMVPEFISQDFSDTYERVHEESLHTMTRDELLAEHVDLERKFYLLQEQLAKTKRLTSSKIHALEAKIDEVEKENESLKSDNERVMNENEVLKGSSSKPETRMSTSDTEETDDAKTFEKLDALLDGEVMKRR